MSEQSTPRTSLPAPVPAVDRRAHAGLDARGHLRLSWAAATDVGKVRRLNEDSLLAADGLYVVADGMGGHAAGDVASALTVDVCREFLDRLPLQPGDLELLVATANTRVRDHATNSGSTGMGTTLVGAVLVNNGGDDSLAIVNVGDSRCYSFDPTHGLTQLTHDHSAVQELIDAGTIDAADAATHPERNVVTRAIGIEAAVAADFVVLGHAPHRRLLLCSDGVSGPLDEAAIAATLGNHRDPVAAADALIAQVLDGPASDNATVIVLDVEWVGAPAESSDDAADITGPRPPVALPPPGLEPVAPVAVAPGLIDSVPIAAATPSVTDPPRGAEPTGSNTEPAADRPDHGLVAEVPR